MRRMNQLTGKAAEAKPKVNDLQPRGVLTPASSVDNGPKGASRRDRRALARQAAKSHLGLTRDLRRAAD